MKKILSVVVILTIVLAVLAGCRSSNVSNDVIKLGYIGPLTGDSAPWGTTELNTLKMLVEQTNANGGVLGKKIQLFSYDNRADNIETQNSAKKLVQQDKVVSIIGTNASGPAIALASVCEELKVPQIATTATNALVTVNTDGKVRPYTFRMCLTDPALGTIMAQYAYSKLNIKSAAILFELGSDYSVGVKDVFKDAFEKIGGKITVVEAYKTGDVDMRAQLSKIKATNPQAIFLPALYKQIALVAKQARDLGITSAFLGCDTWQASDVLLYGGSAIEGSYFDAAVDYADPLLKPFVAQYQAKYNANVLAMGANGVHADDAFLIWIDAVKRAGKADPQAIRDALETTKDVQGCICKISFDADHNAIRDAAIQTISNGVVKSAGTWRISQ